MQLDNTTTRVLLVEDNPSDVRLLKEALRDVPDTQVFVTSVATLHGALTRLSEEQFDVALLDLSVPDAEGLEIVTGVQQKAPALPLVVLTGLDDARLAVQAVREGAQDYLVKGHVDGELLVRSMRYAVERKRAVEAMEMREMHFRRLIEAGSDLIAVLDSELRFKFVSPSIERAIGWRATELMGRHFGIFGDAKEHGALEDVFRRAVADEGELQNFELRLRHRDGGWRWLEATCRSRLSDPVVAGIILNAHDITERKRAAEELRELSERLAAVIDHAPLAIVRMNIDGTVEGWNAGARQIFGWSADEVVGHKLALIPDEMREDFLAHLAKPHSPECREIRRPRSDGTLLDLQLWTAPLRRASGEVRSFVGIILDVTEQKRLENQVRHAQKMEAVGRLAGGVAHDFNNLLTIITGYTGLALKQLKNNEGAAEMEEVMMAAERATSLTRQLLALTRQPTLQHTQVDVNDVVRTCERMVRRLIGEVVELRTELSAARCPVRADRGQLELVLLNLAGNARDAMQHGGVLTIRTEARQDSISIQVTDTGAGMNAELMSHIFEPFFTTKDVGKGTGLGLSTSQEIIRQHGGDIYVHSHVDVGTIFEIVLPVAPSETPHETKVAAPAEAPHGSGTILVLEDDSSVAEVMKDALEAKGYTVLTAYTAAEALAVAHQSRGQIDLLLSDVVLRGSRGTQIAEQMRTLWPGLHVLFVSGYADTDRPPASEHFLQKPFTVEALAHKVSEILVST